MRQLDTVNYFDESTYENVGPDVDVLDASGEDGEDEDGVSLNGSINMDEYKTVLPTMQRYADALAILGPHALLLKANLDYMVQAYIASKVIFASDHAQAATRT
eukprot:COSAG02_NODE_2015_length_10106_cov_9.031578_6_plen_103_part_00